MMAITIATISALIMVVRKKIRSFVKRFRRSNFEPRLIISSKGVGKTSTPSYVALHPSEISIAGRPRKAYFDSQSEERKGELLKEDPRNEEED